MIKHIPRKHRKISSYVKRKKKYKSCDNIESLSRFEHKEEAISRGKRISSSGWESNKMISIGERKIKEYLIRNKIKFTQEKTFKTCINPATKQFLRYDFYISSLKLLIEFDGNQHHAMLKGQNADDFNKQIYRDGLKNQWAVDNSRTLFRIKSWQLQKIDDILDKIINPLLNK